MFNNNEIFPVGTNEAVGDVMTRMNTCPFTHAPLGGGFSPYEANFFSPNGIGVNQNLAHLTSEQRIDRKKAEIERLSQYEWSYFITLTFMYDVKDEIEVSNIINRFVNQLSKAAHGFRSKNRIRIAAVLERFDSGRIHIHLLMEDVVSRIVSPKKRANFNVKNEVAKAWRKCDYKTTSPSRAGSQKGAWFQKVYNVPGVLDYMTKDIMKGSDPVLQEGLSLEGSRFM